MLQWGGAVDVCRKKVKGGEVRDGDGGGGTGTPGVPGGYLQRDMNTTTPGAPEAW